MQRVLKKEALNDFLYGLMEDKKLIAPFNEDGENSKFKVVGEDDVEKIYLDKITTEPPKKFFLPPKETLLKFKGKKVEEVKEEGGERVIFGLRKCDLNSFKILDEVMKDPQWIKRRKNTILIGLFCENPDRYCFCNSMELEDHYDLFFYPHKDKYYISIGSKKGGEIVEELPFVEKEVRKKIKNEKKLSNKNIEGNYENDIWKSLSKKCLSCTACTVNCPTCNCFDIKDKSNIDFKEGERYRQPASCQLKSFSSVAGGKVFRESRLARFKHFVYHKLVYFKKQNNKYMCTGCGRCLRVCPSNIDWVEAINILKDKK